MGIISRKAGGAEIYQVSTSFGETLNAPSTAYIGTTLYSSPALRDGDENGKAILRDVALSGKVREREESFPADSSGVGYQRSEDVQLCADRSPICAGVDNNQESLLSGMTSLSAYQAVTAYPTKEDLAKYGLDTPCSIAELNLVIKPLWKSNRPLPAIRPAVPPKPRRRELIPVPIR